MPATAALPRAGLISFSRQADANRLLTLWRGLREEGGGPKGLHAAVCRLRCDDQDAFVCHLKHGMQATNLESPYLSAISSHFAYWTSADMGLFILRALHHQDVKQGAPKEPAAAKAQPASTEAGVPPPANPPQAAGKAMGSQGGSPVQRLQPGGDVLSPKAVQSPLGLSDPEDWW